MHYMHYKDYIHHDFYVYSPVLLTQYRGHCWHTPCTELYILRISAWLLRKPPLPCHRGGGEPSGWGGCVGVPAHIYTLRYIAAWPMENRNFPSEAPSKNPWGISGFPSPRRWTAKSRGDVKWRKKPALYIYIHGWWWLEPWNLDNLDWLSHHIGNI